MTRIHRSGGAAASHATDPTSDTEMGDGTAHQATNRSAARAQLGTLLRPRVRPDHHLSEGESDSEDPSVLYRALRPDEHNVREHGLHPPEGHDSSITAAAHVRAGTKARTKSAWISATRSKKLASAWAAQHRNGKVVKFRKPDQQVTPSHDLTTEEGRAAVFGGNGGMAVSFAKSSQEVVIKDHVRPENIMEVWNARKALKPEYDGASAQTTAGFVDKLRSRDTSDSTPTRVILTQDVPVTQGNDATGKRHATGGSDIDTGTAAKRQREID